MQTWGTTGRNRERVRRGKREKEVSKTTYTYKDFLSSAAAAGLLSSFSEADLRLAQANPDAGMSILSYKRDYADAATDEARALANAGAERIRSVYGGYTAGAEGTGYRLNESGNTDGSYVNQYEDEQRQLADSLSEGFSYDADSDEAWQSYRRAYLREGLRAYENSLGSAAANTGGVASTAAVTAAQQAQNYYNAAAADKKAELMQQAYENYLAGRAQTVSELTAYDQLDQTAAENHQRDYENRTDAAQRDYENALEKWQSYGYVTEDIADILALPVGTAYSQQAYNEWYQAFQEAVNGVYTGKTLTDTVNADGDGAASYNPAAGDTPANHKQVSQGSSGSDVSAMQTYLIALGYHCGDTGVDGIFGSATRAAVRAFQSDHGLKVDGICGPKTWRALIAALNA